MIPTAANDRTLCIVSPARLRRFIQRKDMQRQTSCPQSRAGPRSRDRLSSQRLAAERPNFESRSSTNLAAETTTLIEASQTDTSGGSNRERYVPAPAQPSAEEDEPAIDLTVERLVDGALIILRDWPDADGLIEVRSFTRGLICWSRNPYLALARALTDVGYADTFTIDFNLDIARRDKRGCVRIRWRRFEPITLAELRNHRSEGIGKIMPFKRPAWMQRIEDFRTGTALREATGRSSDDRNPRNATRSCPRPTMPRSARTLNCFIAWPATRKMNPEPRYRAS